MLRFTAQPEFVSNQVVDCGLGGLLATTREDRNADQREFYSTI